MKLHTKTDGLVATVCFPGQLVMANAASFRHAIRDLVDEGYRYLVMDMSKVDFVDSSGLSVLVSASKAARPDGGEVVLAGLTPSVQALVELTRLHHLFEIFPDERAALAFLRSRSAA